MRKNVPSLPWRHAALDVCIGIAVYTAPDIPRRHLKKYLSNHQRPQYEYVNGRIPFGVQAASFALQTLDCFLPPKSGMQSQSGGAQSLSNPQDAFFKSSAEATPLEFIQKWNAQYGGRSSTKDCNAVQVGPAVQANPFAH